MSVCPEHVPLDRVLHFDPYTDPYKVGDPFAAYERFRGKPLQFSPELGGFWVATDAATVREVFQHPEIFSSCQTSVPPGEAWPRKLIPIELDPPVHGLYRHLMAPQFSPNTVALLKEPVTRVCADLVDELAGRGRCDFVADFARKYPTTIFVVYLLGLPLEMVDEFVRWNWALLHGDRDTKNVQGAQLVEFLARTIAERAEGPPGGDLISQLQTSEIDGRPLSQEEVLDICFLLFMAGLDTVSTSLSFAFRFLADHPQHRRQIVEDPAIIPSAVEELLRFHAFVNPTRTVARAVQFHGVSLEAGDRMHLPGVIASRDPGEFEDAATVIFDRPVNRHLAFGAGPHRCLGSHLARRELIVALSEWHKRIPDYEVPEGAHIGFHGGTTVGLDEVPLIWPLGGH